MKPVSMHGSPAINGYRPSWLQRLGIVVAYSIGLGAISNILTAWAIEYFGTPLRNQYLKEGAREAEIIVTVPNAVSVNGHVQTSIGCETRYICVMWYHLSIKSNPGTFEGEPYVIARPKPVFVVPWNQRLLTKPTNSNSFASYWMERGNGFPFICLYKWQEVRKPLRGAIALPDPQGDHAAWGGHVSRGLPILPIWPALIANTAIHAGLWSVPLLFLPVLTRWRRHRKGQCPACGYDLSANPTGAPCPECGSTR